jgi:hypothetical protein
MAILAGRQPPILAHWVDLFVVEVAADTAVAHGRYRHALRALPRASSSRSEGGEPERRRGTPMRLATTTEPASKPPPCGGMVAGAVLETVVVVVTAVVTVVVVLVPCEELEDWHAGTVTAIATANSRLDARPRR